MNRKLKRFDNTRLKVVHKHPGRTEPEYIPAFPKPGKRIKIDDPNTPYYARLASTTWGRYIHRKFVRCLVNDKYCSGPLHAHHFIGKGANSFLRNHPNNGGRLCDWHHNRSIACSPHAGPTGFNAFLKKKYPEILDWIVENQHRTGKHNYREEYKTLERLIEKLPYQPIIKKRGAKSGRK